MSDATTTERKGLRARERGCACMRELRSVAARRREPFLGTYCDRATGLPPQTPLRGDGWGYLPPGAERLLGASFGEEDARRTSRRHVLG
jgi:hypothetical protein